MKDIGVYEYIDEQRNKVNRATRLNQPELKLSEDQNDVIHLAALGQLRASKLSVDRTKTVGVKLKLRSVASSSAGSDGVGADIKGDQPSCNWTIFSTFQSFWFMLL